MKIRIKFEKQGIGEYMDIEVLSTDDSETMIRRMNETMAEGTRILSYRRLPEESKNAMSIVAAADYLLWFREEKAPKDMESFWSGLSRFCEQEQILIRKKTKKGERDMDLKPLIYEMRRAKTSDGQDGIFLKVSTGSTNNVKPELLAEALYRFLELEYPPFAFEIERQEVYADLGEEGHHRFVSLEDLGEDLSEAVPRETLANGGDE